jgi:hypothetical protein
MRYMLLIAGDPERFAQLPQDEQDSWMGQYFAFTQALVDSGELVAGDPLHGADTATTVSVRDGETITTDGPFVEMKEVIGGYYVIDVADLDRAVQLAARIPDARIGKVEVRPLVEMPDMAAPGA